MESINIKIQQKLERYQELYDSNQKLIYIGQKVDDLAAKYFNSKNKKDLLGELLKIVEMENSKRRKATVKETLVKKEQEKEIEKEVAVKVDAIRAEKKEKKENAKIVVEKPKPILQAASTVESPMAMT